MVTQTHNTILQDNKQSPLNSIQNNNNQSNPNKSIININPILNGSQNEINDFKSNEVIMLNTNSSLESDNLLDDLLIIKNLTQMEDSSFNKPCQKTKKIIFTEYYYFFLFL